MPKIFRTWFKPRKLQHGSKGTKKPWVSRMNRIKNKDLDFQRKVLKSLFKTPTSFERKIIDISKKYHLPYEYVGDGKLWVGGKNPDFINTNGEKLIIETYCSVWKSKDYEKERYKIFAEFGFKTLFLNEKDLICGDWENICLDKIQEFDKY